MARILVVDDEPDILEGMGALLERMGHEPILSGDVDAALSGPVPDLILHDLHMPGLNVAGLVASMRTDPERADVPLVLFSGRSGLAAAARRYDAFGSLSKPFEADELEEVVTAATGEGGTRPVGECFIDLHNAVAALAMHVSPGDPRGRDLIVSLSARVAALRRALDREASPRGAWQGSSRPASRKGHVRPAARVIPADQRLY